MCVCFLQDVLVVNCSPEFMASNHVLATCRSAMRRQGVVGLHMAPCMRAFLERLPIMLQEQYAYEKVCSYSCCILLVFPNVICFLSCCTVQIGSSWSLPAAIHERIAIVIIIWGSVHWQINSSDKLVIMDACSRGHTVLEKPLRSCVVNNRGGNLLASHDSIRFRFRGQWFDFKTIIDAPIFFMYMKG